MKHRDRAGYSCPYGLDTVISSGSFRLAVLIIGLLGSNCFGVGCAGQPSIPKRFKNVAVFAAAPTSSMVMAPDTWAFSSRKAPPPYSNFTFVKLQPTHPVQSTLWIMGLSRAPVAEPVKQQKRSGGTTGIAPSTLTNTVPEGCFAGGGCCASADVWFIPPTNTPAVNDKSTALENEINRVVIRMPPPQNGCRSWNYHGGQRLEWKAESPTVLTSNAITQ